MRSKRIYLASSWRNAHQPGLIAWLWANGFSVYDFRNPQMGGPAGAPAQGFTWQQVDSGWGRSREDLLQRYREMLKHPVAQKGFTADFSAMKWADTCVIALPSGRSAHLECGWMSGAGKKIVVYMPSATKVCEACNGRKWVEGDDHMRNNACHSCEGTGHQMLWSFEPELMYLIGGSPDEVLAFTPDELLERLRT